MLSSQALKQIVTELRPIIERQLADAELITAMREVVTAQGGDWSAIKGLVKAQCQDDLDETGDGNRAFCADDQCIPGSGRSSGGLPQTALQDVRVVCRL